MYFLDFTTMLQMLQTHQQSGTLHAELPSGIPGTKERCSADINVVSGKIVSCQIQSRSGKTRLVNEKALQMLYRLGVLEWKLSIQQPPPDPQGNTAAPKSSPIPQRTVNVERRQVESWPRTHAIIYALIDGKNSVQMISDRSSIPVHIVERVLRDLQSIAVISIRHQ